MGAKKEHEGAFYIGNAATLLFSSGLVLCIIVQLFTTPLLKFFGAPDNVLQYAIPYTKITSFGFPFLIFATGGGHLIPCYAGYGSGVYDFHYSDRNGSCRLYDAASGKG